MKTIHFFSLPLLVVCMHSAFSQVTPNSKRFEVKNYIAIDNNGKYQPYFTHGFAENVGSGSKGKMFIMPLLEVDLEKIKFIDVQGHETTSSNSNVVSITIPVVAYLSLPNESQKAAIGASLTTGSALQWYYPPIVKNNFGGPLINPNAGIYTAQIMAQANQYEQIIGQQQKLIDSYHQFNAEIISLTEYEVIVTVGNYKVYDKRFSGTLISMGSSLDEISIDNPTEYVRNRIAAGNFSILIKYKFRDSKGSYINANLDASVIINQFLSETQKSTVSQKSSGWSFLGFGSSRKSIKSHFDQQIDQQFSDQRISSTTIEMYDADDDMIKLFEDAFFPRLTQQKAIENHQAAAEKAKLDGNTELEKLHLGYVEALKKNDPNLEVDIEKATAALAREDYVGFVAHGVRWGERNATGNNSFRRVLNSSEMTQMTSQWSQTKKISVQHAVSQKVDIEKEEVELRAHLGLLDGIPYQSNMFIFNGFSGQWKNIRGIILGPITVGGTLHQSNITPGSLLINIGSRNVYDGQTLKTAMNNYSPGESITLTMIEQIGPNAFQEKTVSVILGSYPVKTN